MTALLRLSFAMPTVVLFYAAGRATSCWDGVYSSLWDVGVAAQLCGGAQGNNIITWQAACIAKSPCLSAVTLEYHKHYRLLGPVCCIHILTHPICYHTAPTPAGRDSPTAQGAFDHYVQEHTSTSSYEHAGSREGQAGSREGHAGSKSDHAGKYAGAYLFEISWDTQPWWLSHILLFVWHTGSVHWDLCTRPGSNSPPRTFWWAGMLLPL